MDESSDYWAHLSHLENRPHANLIGDFYSFFLNLVVSSSFSNFIQDIEHYTIYSKDLEAGPHITTVISCLILNVHEQVSDDLGNVSFLVNTSGCQLELIEPFDRRYPEVSKYSVQFYSHRQNKKTLFNSQ